MVINILYSTVNCQAIDIVRLHEILVLFGRTRLVHLPIFDRRKGKIKSLTLIKPLHLLNYIILITQRSTPGFNMYPTVFE